MTDPWVFAFVLTTAVIGWLGWGATLLAWGCDRHSWLGSHTGELGDGER